MTKICFTLQLTTPGVLGVSKNPDNQTEVYSGQSEAKIQQSAVFLVGGPRLSQNRGNCEKPSKLSKHFQRNPVF